MNSAVLFNGTKISIVPLLSTVTVIFMQGQRTDWRMYLNNFLQGRYGHTRNLSWVHTQSGPSHDTRWSAIAYFNGIEYGKGVARDRGTAMEIAAETTYRALTSYYN